ncbi:MAG TPA: sulfotransferase [Rhizomicrobium sp.]|nr:sulfotransferase [Rhizomicrobium sp.]
MSPHAETHGRAPALPDDAAREAAARACDEGFAALEAGDPVIAELHADRALREVPDYFDALILLIQCRRLRNARGPEYEMLLRRILGQRPHPHAMLELAEILLTRRDRAECEHHARNAVALAPRNPQAHRIVGLIFLETMRAAAAEHHFRRIIELAGERPRAAAHLADSLKLQGRLDEAEDWFRKSVGLAPGDAEIWIKRCRLAEVRGDLPHAWALLEEAVGAGGETTRTRITRAALLGREGKPAEAEAELTRDIEGAENPDPGALLERGRHREALNRFDGAWADFTEAKRHYREQGFVYDEQTARAAVQSLKQIFTRQRVALWPRAEKPDRDPRPLFVLGYPRSGTTLTEQILAGHPAIRAGDELPFLQFTAQVSQRWIGSRFEYPFCLGELCAGDQRFLPNQLRDCYLGWAEQTGLRETGRTFFTDKMPLNELHLGLLYLLFPHSPLILIRRHPLDVLCSNFGRYIAHGFNQAFAVDSIARHYLLMDELLRHYREQLDLNLHEIRYEDLVTKPEDEVRRMLDFAGLEFDSRCLALQENPRVARTLSYAQVAEGLSDKTVRHYRHFRKHLDSAAAILRPVLDRLGYEAD